jgi:hypothetical protein
MKVLVCGSRDWDDYHAVESRLRHLNTMGNLTVIHGAARGADQMAGTAAAKMGCPVQEFPADWRGKGKRAGIIRNLEMLDQEPDLVLAFWKNGSTGTGHTISEAKKRGIRTWVVPHVLQ